jgi:TorA maturation chaperone TorD
MSAVPPVPTFFQAADAAIAEDAESLAALHDRELTVDLIAALHEARFPACLGLLPATSEANAAWQMMADALADLPPAPDNALLDDLAAEYAAIYLTGALGASPCESVWTDDDHLVCQVAMFQLRDLYAASGLATPDWRLRPDDHLVLQLLYIAHVARTATTADRWRALANMLDEHPLRWIADFAGRVATRSSTHFYAALAVLTATWLETLRDLIARHLGEPRPSRAEIEERLRPTVTPVEQPVAFMPGCGPSW